MLKFYFASIILVRLTPLWEKGRIRIRTSDKWIQILEGQKHPDPDQHWFQCLLYLLFLMFVFQIIVNWIMSFCYWCRHHISYLAYCIQRDYFRVQTLDLMASQIWILPFPNSKEVWDLFKVLRTIAKSKLHCFSLHCPVTCRSNFCTFWPPGSGTWRACLMSSWSASSPRRSPSSCRSSGTRLSNCPVTSVADPDPRIHTSN